MDIITNWQLIHGKISLIFLLGMVLEIWSITDRIFFVLDHFLPFYLSNNTKNQNFENLKKTLGDIILHTHTKNHDHMIHCSLDMVHNGCHFYFLFWAIFCPFTSLTAKKSKLKKKEKKCLEISFYNSVPKIIICYTVAMACDRCNYFSFWAIFCTFTPLTAQKKKI